MKRQNAILRHIKNKIPHNSITDIIPVQMADRAMTIAIHPHNIADKAKQSTIKTNRRADAQTIPSIMARQTMERARTTPMAPKTSSNRKRAGEHTMMEHIQDRIKSMKHTRASVMQDIPTTQEIKQVIIANMERHMHMIEDKIPSRQKIHGIMKVQEQIMVIITEIMRAMARHGPKRQERPQHIRAIQIRTGSSIQEPTITIQVRTVQAITIIAVVQHIRQLKSNKISKASIAPIMAPMMAPKMPMMMTKRMSTPSARLGESPVSNAKVNGKNAPIHVPK